MLQRVSSLCAIGVVLSTALLQAQDLFVLPGSQSTSGLVEAFLTNPLNIYRTFNAGLGSFAVLPNLDASKFFIVSSSTTNSILAVGPTLLSPALVANLASSASQAIITPNESLLAVAAGTVHLFNVASNNELVVGGISQGSGVNTFAVASSLDSSAIFALGSNGAGSSELSLISTGSYSVTANLSLSQLATAISVGPNGLVYVSLPNQILELDPRTLQTTYNGEISVNGTPGPLVFTPDGQYGLSADQSSFGNSLIIASLATHTATDPALGVAELSTMQVIGVNTILALSNQGLYEITISPLSVTPITVPDLTGGLFAFTTTNDVPLGIGLVQAVYLVSADTLYQFSPASRQFVNQLQVGTNVTPGAISYALPTSTTTTSQPASLLTYGINQTILPSASSEPLVVQVLDANNLPLSGSTVNFQIGGNSSGATLSSNSAVTGSNGYALTYVNASSTPGTITVTATAGELSAHFAVTVTATAQGGGGPTLSIVAGQGQLMLADTSTAVPGYGASLQVYAADVNGNPIVGLPVTFSVPSSEGSIQVNGNGASSQTVDTNSSGVASVDFLTTLLPSNDALGYLQSLVTASASNTNTVTFYITTVDTSPSPSIYVLAPTSGTTLIGAEESTLPAAVKVQIVSDAGVGIPNVSLGVNDNNANASLVPTVFCDAPGGLALSGTNGVATCDLTFGPRIGLGTFVATIGYTRNSFPIQFMVTVGAPATLQIAQGNNQTGIPGQKLPLALVVHATDSGGNVATGAAVNWQVVTPGTVTLSNIVGITDSNGDASALATLGSVGGVAQVTATAGSATASFNLTVNIPSTGIQKVSGDQQSTLINTAFALPLTVKVVDSSGAGVTGAQVNFQVATGSATLGSSSVVTDSTGQASTTVTAGATAGAITVTATTASFSVTFSLTSLPPGPSNITIVNGASFDPNTGISPGGIATIRGMGILPGLTGLVPAANSAGQLPLTFSGVTITFNGTAAPIYYVENTNGLDQVSVQVPFEVQPGPAVALTITVASGSATVMVPVKPLAPGVFTSSYGGQNYAVAVRPDGSYVSPTNPAQRGENIDLYVTGLGQATPTIATGAAGVADQTVSSRLLLGLNNGGVPVVAAVYGPGLIGVYVITIQVPADTQTGPYQPVGVIAYDSANNIYFAQPSYIPIQ
jgi:uncharacterized protein (TIGR03437 family)